MFYVGQKVVCIRDDMITCFGREGEATTGLRKGAVYTIKAIRQATGYHFNGSIVVNGEHTVFDLNETSPSKAWDGFKGYSSMRFRPVAERKTDISIFTAMLNTAKTPERV